jgi:hypothetical protein
MASNNSTITTVAQPGRRATACELRKLPDDLLERLLDVAHVVSDCEEEGSFRFEATGLLDDIQEAAGIPDIHVPLE